VTSDNESAAGGRLIVNPISGERITIPPGGADGDALVWELLLAPGGQVPSSHAHPKQEERFTVTEGRMRFRVGRRRLLAGPGDTVVVPPGTAHHFANPGPAPARVTVRTAPALDMRELLETAAALAREQHADGRALPRLGELALFMRDFEAEVAAPVLPRLVRLVMRLVTAVAGPRRPGARYHRLRHGDGVA
jgi:mannose-6-phosphate isomerase-like protein (cupin superfamily)